MGWGKQLRIVQRWVKEHIACLLAPGGSLKIKGLKSYSWCYKPTVIIHSLYLLCRCCLSLQSCPTLCDPTDHSLQVPLSMGFSRQEYQSGLPCPPQGYLPDPGTELASHVISGLAGRFFTAEPPGKPCIYSKE